jgi:hypothetical protein
MVLNKTQDQHYKRDHEKNVYQAATYLEAESEKPEHQ